MLQKYHCNIFISFSLDFELQKLFAQQLFAKHKHINIC